ncbi:hypothetical protein HHI36_006914 [Cryptolaemus montrouzieri]|uniref:Uncharacterized protein n=1 Tax=Cryptolaemus montrouzieri TaxID=559131 RepID=A0ABD2MNG5_9CUCU
MNVFRGWITRQSPRSISYEQIRSIPRWASRVPKKVYLPEETEPLDTVLRENNKPEHKKRNSFNYPTTFSFQGKEIAETSGNNVDNKSVRREKLETLTLRKAKKKEETSDMLETIIDGEGNLVYTKMNNNDSRIAQILSNLKSDKSLKKQESILLEERD